VAIAKRPTSVLDHRAQVARARRFVDRHVGDEVRLASVARAAGASKFHLARLYRAITGETIGRTITRTRIERAAAALAERPARSISEIALEVGFGTPSSLNKAFRAALGLSPTEFRRATHAQRRRRLARLDVTPPPPAFTLAPPVVARCEPMRVVYVRERGPYSGISAPLAWAQLEVRLASTKLLAGQLVAASHDDPATVPADELRYDAGVIVGPHVTPPAGTEIAIWPGGTFAAFAFRGDYAAIEAATAQIGAGLAGHGFTFRDAPCYELYRGGRSPLTELWIPIEDP